MSNFSLINICPFCRQELFFEKECRKSCVNSNCPNKFNRDFTPFIACGKDLEISSLAYHFIRKDACNVICFYTKGIEVYCFGPPILSNQDYVRKNILIQETIKIKDPYDLKFIEEMLDNILLFS